MSATVLDRRNNPVDIGYTVNVSLEYELDWDGDEEPTGWNYGTDQPTYTTSSWGVAGKLLSANVEFIDVPFIIGDDEVAMKDALQALNPESIRHLLDPKIYENVLGSLIDEKAKEADLPEPDFDEPDRD